MYSFCFNIPQDPSRVLCGRDVRQLLRKCDLNTANDGASAKASQFHIIVISTNSIKKKRLSILAGCMTNMSKFHAVFSSSTLIRLNKGAFEGHLCQTVNNCFSIFHRTRT